MGWRFTLIAVLFLTSCLTPAGSGSKNFSACEDSNIILLPHHLLVDMYIEDMYKALANDEAGKIIIVSPNHLLTQYPEVAHSAEEEFGFTPHRDFAEQYMPNAEIEGWMIKQGASRESLDWLVDEITAQDSTFIFSVDFSHYLPGDIAFVHDLRSKDIIEAGLAEEALTLEVDSPESLYVMLSVAAQKNLSIEILKNTNPALDADINTFENTTHMFGCSNSEPPKERQLTTSMYFQHMEDWYLGLTEEDRYLYGYDEVFFNESNAEDGSERSENKNEDRSEDEDRSKNGNLNGGDTAVIERSDGTKDIYKFSYFD